jgi:hypothetical protein
MSMRAGETGTCPHCRTGVRFESIAIDRFNADLAQVTVRAQSRAWLQLFLCSCPVCGMLIIDAPICGDTSGSHSGGPGVIYPKGATRPLPLEVAATAPTLATDFAEAVAVLASSRKASAALSRRCLQFILANAAKTKKRDLADQIDEVLTTLPPQLAENVDAIRHVGNYAAHPMKSTNSGEIAEVEDGEAEWLLDVIEELCDFYYVAPARAAAKRAALNQKLADLGKPPLKQP